MTRVLAHLRLLQPQEGRRGVPSSAPSCFAASLPPDCRLEDSPERGDPLHRSDARTARYERRWQHSGPMRTRVGRAGAADALAASSSVPLQRAPGSERTSVRLDCNVQLNYQGARRRTEQDAGFRLRGGERPSGVRSKQTPSSQLESAGRYIDACARPPGACFCVRLRRWWSTTSDPCFTRPLFDSRRHFDSPSHRRRTRPGSRL